MKISNARTSAQGETYNDQPISPPHRKGHHGETLLDVPQVETPDGFFTRWEKSWCIAGLPPLPMPRVQCAGTPKEQR